MEDSSSSESDDEGSLETGIEEPKCTIKKLVTEIQEDDKIKTSKSCS